MIGMLWQLNPRETLRENIGRASAYFAQKYGSSVTWCQVRTTNIDPALVQAFPGVRISHSIRVAPGHLWIGNETERLTRLDQ